MHDRIRKSLPVFPDAATWDERTQTIELDGAAAVIGDEVVLGGGEVGNPSLIASRPPGCDTSLAFQVFTISVGADPRRFR